MAEVSLGTETSQAQGINTHRYLCKLYYSFVINIRSTDQTKFFLKTDKDFTIRCWTGEKIMKTPLSRASKNFEFTLPWYITMIKGISNAQSFSIMQLYRNHMIATYLLSYSINWHSRGDRSRKQSSKERLKKAHSCFVVSGRCIYFQTLSLLQILHPP